MAVEDACVEPKVGARIGEFIADAPLSAEKKLAPEEIVMLVLHLLRCSFCRQKLDEDARFYLETMCILLGVFIDDPVLRRKRQEHVRQHFSQDDTAEDYDPQQSWYDVTPEERRKIKALWEKDN